MRGIKPGLIAILATGLLAGSAVGVVAQDEETASPMASAAPASPIIGTAAPTADPALSGFVGTVPPNGAYSAEITSEDLVAKGASPEFAQQNQGTWTWTFADGTFALLQSPYIEGCSGTYESIDGTLVRMVTTVETECGYRGDILWAPEPDGIRLQQLQTEQATDEQADIDAYFDRVFVRVD